MMTRSLLGLRVGIFILTFLFAFWGLPALFVGQPGPASISDKLLLQIKNGSGQEGVSKLELSRPARAWEFLGAVGTRAGIFGSESGPFEVWVYPLKILHDLKLRFHVPGRILPAESLARTTTVRPESCSILYTGDSFTARETLFVPLREAGAIISIEVATAEPLEIEATFERDFQLIWPAALGGTYMDWNEKLHAFVLGEEQKRFFALVGSLSATEHRQEFFTSYASSHESSFKLGLTGKGQETKQIVVAASMQSQSEAEATYQRISADFQTLRTEAASHYEHYLDQTLSLRLPDSELQRAYDWSRISLVQGIVSNPFLGTGLVAGYRTSGKDARPGFAWYFGRDALWSALALIAVADFANTRTALDFLIKYQREDGKIAHEIAQTANFVPWFKDYPYAYASADATPLFIITMNEYAVTSGDLNFVKDRWASVWKAYEFLRSTWDSQGFAQNQQAGHGWVEGGPLLPVKTELYQSSLGVAALQALANLAHLMANNEMQKELEREFARQKTFLNDAFWIPEKRIFAFGLDKENAKVAEASVLATVPMWFRLLDAEKANAMIDQLADVDHAADWGMRILSSRSERFHPAGYHFGAVWPLFTGWAAVGEYRYHRAFPGYANLRANALLALDGALGRVTEVLSGGHYAPLSVSSPHQIWSSAMVINPLLGGLLGLEVDSAAHRFALSPHVPPDWDSFELHNLRVDSAAFNLIYRQTPDLIELELQRSGASECFLEFSPGIALRAKVIGAEINNRPVAFRVEANGVDQHVAVRFPIYGGRNTLQIRLHDNFALHVPVSLPPLGATSSNLKVLSESWSASHDRLEVEVSGLAGREYQILAWGAAQISKLEGAELVRTGQQGYKIVVRLPSTPGHNYTRHKITFEFAAKHAPAKPSGGT